MTRDANCAVWDSYLGECREMYAAEWWEYINVFSIGAVAIIVLAWLVIFLVLTIPDRRHRR